MFCMMNIFIDKQTKESYYYHYKCSIRRTFFIVLNQKGGITFEEISKINRL